MITFDRVSFRYNVEKETSFQLKEVSFSMKKGEIYALVGSNGAGKSTIAGLMTGLLIPTDGNVYICDINTKADDDEIYKKIGIIFQNPQNQIVGTTVEEEIAFGLENMNIPNAVMREKVLSISQKFNLDKMLKTPVYQLSGGQQQLLCIASIMAMNPEWIIFDEPTSHLDPWARENFWKLIEELIEEENKGVVVISQCPEDIEYCNHIVVLDSGKVVYDKEIIFDNESIDMLEKLNVALPESILYCRMMNNCE